MKNIILSCLATILLFTACIFDFDDAINDPTELSIDRLYNYFLIRTITKRVNNEVVSLETYANQNTPGAWIMKLSPPPSNALVGRNNKQGTYVKNGNILIFTIDGVSTTYEFILGVNTTLTLTEVVGDTTIAYFHVVSN